nr:hypothetical protein [Pseudomonadota bacterium]
VCNCAQKTIEKDKVSGVKDLKQPASQPIDLADKLKKLQKSESESLQRLNEKGSFNPTNNKADQVSVPVNNGKLSLGMVVVNPRAQQTTTEQSKTHSQQITNPQLPTDNKSISSLNSRGNTTSLNNSGNLANATKESKLAHSSPTTKSSPTESSQLKTNTIDKLTNQLPKTDELASIKSKYLQDNKQEIQRKEARTIDIRANETRAVTSNESKGQKIEPVINNNLDARVLTQKSTTTQIENNKQFTRTETQQQTTSSKNHFEKQASQTPIVNSDKLVQISKPLKTNDNTQNVATTYSNNQTTKNSLESRTIAQKSNISQTESTTYPTKSSTRPQTETSISNLERQQPPASSTNPDKLVQISKPIKNSDNIQISAKAETKIIINNNSLVQQLNRGSNKIQTPSTDPIPNGKINQQNSVKKTDLDRILVSATNKDNQVQIKNGNQDLSKKSYLPPNEISSLVKNVLKSHALKSEKGSNVLPDKDIKLIKHEIQKKLAVLGSEIQKPTTTNISYQKSMTNTQVRPTVNVIQQNIKTEPQNPKPTINNQNRQQELINKISQIKQSALKSDIATNPQINSNSISNRFVDNIIQSSRRFLNTNTYLYNQLNLFRQLKEKDISLATAEEEHEMHNEEVSDISLVKRSKFKKLTEMLAKQLKDIKALGQEFSRS